MKIHTDYITNSSSASFILYTNVNFAEFKTFVRKKYAEGKTLYITEPEDLDELFEYMQDKDKILSAYDMSHNVLNKVSNLIELDEDDDDYDWMKYNDEDTGRIRYKIVLVFKADKISSEWYRLMDLVDICRDNNDINVEIHRWDI